MENEKLFDFMTKMYAEMKDGFKKVDERFDKVDERLNKVESDVNLLKKSVLNIEHDHSKKIEALFDAATQHTAQLTRIENEVKRQDEIILRKVK